MKELIEKSMNLAKKNNQVLPRNGELFITIEQLNKLILNDE